MDTGTRDFSQLLNRRCKRKDVRRERKRLKKTARIAYVKKKPIDKIIAESTASAESSRKKRKKRKKGRRKGKNGEPSANIDSSELPSMDVTNELEAFKTQAAKQRAELMRDEAGDEDAEIRRLEKRLGYDQKTQKSTRSRKAEAAIAKPRMPKVFQAEGLDYILEVCDPSLRARIAEEDSSGDDNGDEPAFEEENNGESK